MKAPKSARRSQSPKPTGKHCPLGFQVNLITIHSTFLSSSRQKDGWAHTRVRGKAVANSTRVLRLLIMKLSAPIDKAHLSSLRAPLASLSASPTCLFAVRALHLPVETLTSSTLACLLRHRSALGPQPRATVASCDTQE